jgi:biotin carboxylase
MPPGSWQRPAPSRESYLASERILEAAARTRADAIHPGYGFLSENADFAEVVERAGILWVGPPAGVIRTMGDKSAARQAMTAAGVPIVPVAHNAGTAWGKNAFLKHPGMITVSIGPTIDPQGRKPTALIQEVEQWIEAEVARLGTART